MKSILIIFLLIILSIPAISPFFHEGYFPTHDGEWAIVRLTDMFRELKDFQIPPRYSGNLNFGYGYPLFNFTYPFPYYLGFFLNQLNLGFVDSIKILFAASVPLSGLAMFYSAKTLWGGTLSGFVSGVLYMYLPYRLVDLYARGSLGESLSFVLFPAILFFILKVFKHGKIIYIILAGLIFGILVLTHNIMAVYFSLFLVLFFLGRFLFISKKNIFLALSSIALGLGISTFFWLPAFLEKKYILLSQIPIADRNLYYVSLEQLLFSPFGYGTPTDSNSFTYQLGLPHLILLFVVILYLIISIMKNYKEKKVLNMNVPIIIMIIFLFIFLQFKESKILWTLPLLTEINYPWTLLGPLGFLISIIGGFLVTQKYIKLLALVLSFIAIILYLPYAKPINYIDRVDDFYLTNDATTTSSNELMPLWVKKIPSERLKEKVKIIKGVGRVENVVYNSRKIAFDVLAEEEAKIRVNTIYYPGWNAKVNAQNTEITYDNEKGVMDIKIPKGENKVELNFSETPLRLTADIISAFTFIIIILVIFNFHLHRMPYNKS